MNGIPSIYMRRDGFTNGATYEESFAIYGVPLFDFVPVPDGTAHDERILSFCYSRARKASEIAGYLGISDSNYFRKKILENLVVHGYLEKNKVGRTFYFKTNQNVK